MKFDLITAIIIISIIIILIIIYSVLIFLNIKSNNKKIFEGFNNNKNFTKEDIYNIISDYDNIITKRLIPYKKYFNDINFEPIHKELTNVLQNIKNS